MDENKTATLKGWGNRTEIRNTRRLSLMARNVMGWLQMLQAVTLVQLWMRRRGGHVLYDTWSVCTE